MFIILLYLAFAKSLRPSPNNLLDEEARIVNGVPIEASTYPWMVSLRVIMHRNSTDSNEEFHFCGGSLIEIAPPIILTAAHCVCDWGEYDDTKGYFNYSDYDNTTFPVHLFADINRTDANNDTGEVYQTLNITGSMIHNHEQFECYNSRSDPYAGDDIALIIFDDDQSLSFVESDLPSLPKKNYGEDERCCFDGQSLDLIGYGSDYWYGPGTETLEHTKLQYMNMSECSKEYFEGIMHYWNESNVTVDTIIFDHNRFVCAIENNKSACHGDSGGPLFDNSEGKSTIVGLVSFGLGGICNSGVPNVFTSVGHYIDWIDDTIDYALYGIVTNSAISHLHHGLGIVICIVIFTLL